MSAPRTLSAALALLVLVAWAPATAAGETPTCQEATVEATQLGEAYVREDGESQEAWLEANDLEGLQTEACEDAEGTHHDADEHVTTVPDDAEDQAAWAIDVVEGLLEGCTGAGIGLAGAAVCPTGSCAVVVWIYYSPICV